MKAEEAWGVTNRLRFVSVRGGGKRASSPYMGLTIPGERLLPKLPKFGLVVGCVGIGMDFGAGLRLNALILKDNFAQGCSEAKEASLEFGFKLIFIIYYNIILVIKNNSKEELDYYYLNYFELF